LGNPSEKRSFQSCKALLVPDGERPVFFIEMSTREQIAWTEVLTLGLVRNPSSFGRSRPSKKCVIQTGTETFQLPSSGMCDELYFALVEQQGGCVSPDEPFQRPSGSSGPDIILRMFSRRENEKIPLLPSGRHKRSAHFVIEIQNRSENAMKINKRITVLCSIWITQQSDADIDHLKCLQIVNKVDERRVW
jgi:hypothetical protein